MTDDERAAVMKAYENLVVQNTQSASANNWIYGNQIPVAPAPPAPPAEPEAKPGKPIHEMTFADYKKGVESWWPTRKR